MSTVFDDDIIMHQIAAPGLPGDGFTKPEAAQLRSDLDDLLARPVIDELDDIPNVDAASPSAGDALQFDGTNWVPVELVNGIDLYTGSTLRVEGANDIRASNGLEFTDSSTDGRSWLLPIYGGTGSANRISRSDHRHSNPLPEFHLFSATGYMSGGTRQIISRSVQLQAGIQYVVIARFRPQVRGADPGAAYYRLTIDINGNPKTSPGGQGSGFWCVQGVPKKEEWSNARPAYGTGQSITISASVSYHSGAGFNVDAGELEIELKPDR